MEEKGNEFDEIRLEVARSLADFIKHIAYKEKASEPEMMAMTRAASVVQTLSLYGV